LICTSQKGILTGLVQNIKGQNMADLKEMLKNAVQKFKRAQVVEPEGLRKMRVVREAAKEEARKIQAGKE